MEHTQKNRPYFRATRLLSLSLLLLSLSVLSPTYGQVSVLTQHNNNARTGANLNETILNTSNVNVNQFGLLGRHVLDDWIFSQALVAANVSIGGGTHNVVY